MINLEKRENGYDWKNPVFYSFGSWPEEDWKLDPYQPMAKRKFLHICKKCDVVSSIVKDGIQWKVAEFI